MRDGNDLGIQHTDLGCFGLKPTYEGWKHVRVKDVVHLCFRLKPTYEGWKQYFFGNKVASIIGLKPTYEGWKLTFFTERPIKQK